MSDSALSITGVTKRYGEFTAVLDLSLTVTRGVVFGLLGPNGAGKTTTLRMINDILKPDHGEILILGGLSPGRAASRRMGYLPEERGLYPKMKVIETLQFFGELKGLARREAARRASAWLERLDLAKWRTNKVQDLSKGMQQKLQFVAAILHDPELLILDEPWSGLDPINADVLLDIVLELKRAGRTILFSTHLMDQAERVCDSVCILARSRKVADGRVADLKRAAARDRSVAITFAGLEDARRARPTLEDTELVASFRENDDSVRAELRNGKEAQTLLEKLVATGVGLRRFELAEPSLHQIFVERVKTEEQAHD